MKTWKKVAAVLLSIVLTVCVILACVFVAPMLGDKSMLPKETTKYTADGSGERIANIPYDDYLSGYTLPSAFTKADGLTESNTAEANTTAIQGAIDAASENGGGVVYIPSGTYKFILLTLKSNVTLYIDKGAELVSLTLEEQEQMQQPSRPGVITADGAQNIRITGGGTINGMGLTYTEEPKNSTPLYPLAKFNLYTRVIEARKRIHMAKTSDRPSILYLHNCKNVTIDGIVLKDTASWTCQLAACENVTIQNMIIDNNMHIANSDGIDITGGSHYTIKHCFVATGDDGLCIKSTVGDVSDVHISDCTVASFANCFKIGTETEFDISNVDVADCEFFLPDGITGGYAGIAVESADGANIANVHIANIEMTGISSPVLIWLGNRLNRGRDAVGSIDGVVIENVTAKNVELASAVTGVQTDDETYKVQNVTLRNFNVTYRDTAERLNVRKHVSEAAMHGYPEITRVSHIYILSHETSKYWDLPCYGIFIRHTENVTLENFHCTPRSGNTRDFATLTDTDTVIDG